MFLEKQLAPNSTATWFLSFSLHSCIAYFHTAMAHTGGVSVGLLHDAFGEKLIAKDI
jgi:hypothetical protein